MDLVVTHEPRQNRFVAHDDSTVAGIAEYLRTEAGVIVFTHTEVPAAYEGQGVGSALAQFALDFARANNLAVLPVCSFISGWIARHAEYAVLLYRSSPSQVSD